MIRIFFFLLPWFSADSTAASAAATAGLAAAIGSAAAATGAGAVPGANTPGTWVINIQSGAPSYHAWSVGNRVPCAK